MALTFPLVMPADFAAAEAFEISRVDFDAPTVGAGNGGGAVGGVTLGFPIWTARWTIARAIRRETTDQLLSMRDALRGRQRLFRARPQDRPFPWRYPNGFTGLSRAGGGAFDGTAAWSLNADRDVLSLTTLPAGLILSAHDYGMFRWETGGAPRRALVRMVETVTANGSGALSITVEPGVPTRVPSGAVFDLVRPETLMRLDTEETRLSERDRNGRISGVLAGIESPLP
jgi:hypothetical protein